MIQQLLLLLPRHIDPIALGLAVVGSILGLFLWLGGSRFNRTLMTLVAVTCGAALGMWFPVWFTTPLEGWASATLGAIVFGITGYAFHRLWVGAGLGLVLAGWGALACVVFCSPSQPFTWPAVDGNVQMQVYASELWNSLSPDARRLMPFACAAAMLMGLTISVVWQRLGIVLLYSCTGISLLVGLGTAVVSSAQPQWLSVIPNQTSSQVIVLLSMAAFGAIVQWRVAPRSRGPQAVRS